MVPIVGSGTFEDPYRAETLGRRGSGAVMPSHEEGHPRHGHPKHDVALVIVSSDDHGPLASDPRIYPVGDLVDLDRPVAGLDDAKCAWIDAVTEHRQISSDGSVRDVVRRLGQQLQADFDEGNYWVK